MSRRKSMPNHPSSHETCHATKGICIALHPPCTAVDVLCIYTTPKAKLGAFLRVPAAHEPMAQNARGCDAVVLLELNDTAPATQVRMSHRHRSMSPTLTLCGGNEEKTPENRKKNTIVFLANQGNSLLGKTPAPSTGRKAYALDIPMPHPLHKGSPPGRWSDRRGVRS